MAQLNADIPPDLKKAFDLYCVKKDIHKKDAIVMALELLIKQK